MQSIICSLETIAVCFSIAFQAECYFQINMVDYSQQFSISILSFTFLFIRAFSVLVFNYLLIHNLYISSLRSCMQFQISLLTFEQSHHFLSSLWDTEQYRHLINCCPPIFSESSFFKHNQAFDNN